MGVNKYLNNLLNTEDVDYVIASDTDSIYINFGPLADKILSNKLSNKVETVEIINKICEDKLEPSSSNPLIKIFASHVNAYDQKMQMKRENIADRGIWTAKEESIF